MTTVLDKSFNFGNEKVFLIFLFFWCYYAIYRVSKCISDLQTSLIAVSTIEQIVKVLMHDFHPIMIKRGHSIQSHIVHMLRRKYQVIVSSIQGIIEGCYVINFLSFGSTSTKMHQKCWFCMDSHQPWYIS